MESYLLSKEKGMCCGCGACAFVCVKGAISLERDDEGFLYPSINEEKCIKCGKCIQVCEFYKDHSDKKHDYIESYVCKHKDKHIVENSSSGGVFTAVSDLVLKNGGYVCGTVFDDNFDAICICTNEIEVRNKMRGSKYLQNNTNNIYERISDLLSSGEYVMFCGTPCQCAEVRRVFKGASNLFLVDFICHGVSSPLIFDDYKNFLVEQFNHKIESFSFRYKITNKSSQCIKSNLGKYIYVMPSGKDLFYKLFLNDIILRHSCYKCNYTSLSRYSDLTIGDYPASKQVNPTFDNENGVSLVIVNTEKGMKLFKDIDDLHFDKSDIKQALQPQMKHPVKIPNIRNAFWIKYKEKGFLEAYNSLFHNLNKIKLIIRIEKVLCVLHIFKPLLMWIKNIGRVK